MRSGRTVDAAMMFNTKCLKIRRIEAELRHLLECSGRFTRNLVVYIDGRSHEAFSLAQFAEWILLELPLSELLPSFGVQQMLVVFVPAHIMLKCTPR